MPRQLLLASLTLTTVITVALAVAVWVGTQHGSTLIGITLRSESGNTDSNQVIALLDATRPGIRATIELPSSSSHRNTVRSVNSRYLFYSRPREQFGVEVPSVLFDLDTHRSLEVPGPVDYIDYLPQSPDGRYIAYVTYHPQDYGPPRYSLHRIDLQAWRVSPIAEYSRQVTAVGWTRDNALLYFRTGVLFTLHPDAVAPERLVFPNAGRGWITDAALSPDRTRIALSVEDWVSRETSLYVVDLYSGAVFPVGGGDTGFMRPNPWSPDSRWLAMYAHQRSQTLLCIFDTQTARLSTFETDFPRRNGPIYQYVSWSPDGQYAATTVERYGLSSKGYSRTFLIDLAAAEVDVIAKNLGSTGRWSDDGRYLIVYDRSGDILPQDAYTHVLDLHPIARQRAYSFQGILASQWLPESQQLIIGGVFSYISTLSALTPATGEYTLLADFATSVFLVEQR